MDAAVPDFTKVTGIQDHDPIPVHTVPWTTPYMPEPVCAMWNRRDIQKYQQPISQLMLELPTPHAVDEVEATYSAVTAHMLTVMRETNEKKEPIERRPSDVTDLAQVVRQLAKQAKRCSKTNFRRVTQRLLTPPLSQPFQPPQAKYNTLSKETRPGPPMLSIWYHHDQLPLTLPATQCKNSGLWHSPPEKNPLVLTVFRLTSSPHCPIRFSLLYRNVLYCVMSPATYHTSGLYPRRFVSSKERTVARS